MKDPGTIASKPSAGLPFSAQPPLADSCVEAQLHCHSGRLRSWLRHVLVSVTCVQLERKAVLFDFLWAISNIHHALPVCVLSGMYIDSFSLREAF